MGFDVMSSFREQKPRNMAPYNVLTPHMCNSTEYAVHSVNFVPVILVFFAHLLDFSRHEIGV